MRIGNVREKETAAMHIARTQTKSGAIGIAAWLAATAVLLSGCPATRRDASPLPTAPASIAGHVEAVQLPSILVVADGPQAGGSDRASVRLHTGTHVLWRTGAAAAVTDVRVGQQVRVWFDGPVMESYPVQAVAGVLVIEQAP
jgi:hypothetical protein